MRKPGSHSHSPQPGQILWQNQHILVSWKPAAYLSVPSQLGHKDPRPIWGKILEEQLTQRLYPVHRLDFAVEGIILFAKTSYAQRLLQNAFTNKKVNKWYQAFSFGGNWSKPFVAQWKSKILSGKKRAYERDWGETAITEARLVKIWSYKHLTQSGLETYWLGNQPLSSHLSASAPCAMDHSLKTIPALISSPVYLYEWRLFPVTGKRHQLRFELYKHQSPIIGDQLYGSPFALPDERIALRALELALDKQIAHELSCPARFTLPPWPQPKSCAET